MPAMGACLALAGRGCLHQVAGLAWLPFSKKKTPDFLANIATSDAVAPIHPQLARGYHPLGPLQLDSQARRGIRSNPASQQPKLGPRMTLRPIDGPQTEQQEPVHMVSSPLAPF
ncbi:hypothetical protein MAPG_09312 [Magnaporthiopsis poae ATCC 64411]|uniref:Uncharacterized protein n=1 Tax=Magnaporthiopsis poae (strain ATCC 64411 / 73-15) TaxID=644358 RepID=A0A0C4E9L7_MAGP6|nr:hypothetical protein MAPG_09312 [Magnaporthiopsis poae ATCC 64411]